MNEAELFELLGDRVNLLALSVTRVATVFALLPLFSREGIPALVRNAMFLALTLVAMAVQPPVAVEGLTTAAWIGLFAKEAFIGAVIGIFFGLYLWAFEAAGIVIDMQIGASFALFFDPIVGNEVTLVGAFLSRWASWLFVAAGGLLLLVGALVESFAVWPVTRPIEGLRAASVVLFETELSRFMSLTLSLAGPIMLVLFLVDASMGLLNRYAPQFNVFFLSMSIKLMAAVVLLMMLLPFLAEVMFDEMAVQGAEVRAILERIVLP